MNARFYIRFNVNSILPLDINLTIARNGLANAEEIFKTSPLDSQTTKDEIIKNLNSSFASLQSLRKADEKIPGGYENMASRIFFLYAKCLYGGSMQASRRMFELALTTQLVNLKVFDSNRLPQLGENLQHIPLLFSADSKEFEPLMNYLMTTSNEEIVRIAQAEGMDNAFNFAASLRWLGATYQNIDSFNDKAYAPLFEKVYGGASQIWKAIALQGDFQWKKDCHWEIAQVIYNTMRFRHYLQNPNDTKGALETLKGVEPYLAAEGDTLRAQQLRAQIHNITAIDLGKLTPVDFKLCYDETAKAEAIAASTPEFNPFLKVMFLSNKASRALDCLKAGSSVADIQEIRNWFGTVLSAIEQEKYNHYYHSFFLINAAKCEIFDQQKEAAQKLLNKAEEVANMYPDSSTDAKKAIEKLRLEIN